MITVDSIKGAKWAYSARRIAPDLVAGIALDVCESKAGELLIGQVISVGHHARIQLDTGRPSTLYPGDIIVMPCGARYAPDQFEGHARISADGCDMLAGGGCLGEMVWKHDKTKAPTRVLPLGRLIDQTGKPLDTKDHTLPVNAAVSSIPLIVVVGTSMNSGKTTATVALAHGLTKAGLRVAALKGTGTGSFGDVNDYADAGAFFVADFTDAGMVTTYLEPMDRIRQGISLLLAAAEKEGAQVAVMELADGIFQKETAALLADYEFQQRLSGVIFACGDAVAASGGVLELSRNGLHPVRLTGLLSCSPMASAEATATTGVQVISRSNLMDPAVAIGLYSETTGNTRVAA